MRKTIHIVIMLLIADLFVVQMVQAQGTLYLSNIRQGTFGSFGIGNNLWLAQGIETGTDSGGYALNSVQLEMAAATGNPSGLIISVYGGLNGTPSADLGALSGSSNPSSAGLYTYTASGLTLAPSTEYFIVATSATPTTQGYYAWVDNPYGSPYTSVDEWSIQPDFGSANGSDWTGLRADGFQTRIYATAVPEHSTWVLCLVGGGFAFYVHARKRPTSQARLD